MTLLPRHRLYCLSHGFSLAELLTTVAVLGILSTLALESYSRLQNSAREGVARDKTALLNRALLHFNQSNWDIVLDAVPSATSDELAVLRTLQWRSSDSSAVTPGGPYIPLTFGDTVSSSADEYRIEWNGRTFQVLAPGTGGAGILAIGAGSSSASSYSYPQGYAPLGSNQHE